MDVHNKTVGFLSVQNDPQKTDLRKKNNISAFSLNSRISKVAALASLLFISSSALTGVEGMLSSNGGRNDTLIRGNNSEVVPYQSYLPLPFSYISPLGSIYSKSYEEELNRIKSSKIFLNEYLGFVENLDPNQPEDAIKILVGKNGVFNSKEYNRNRNEYIRKLFRKTAAIIHPDKCPSDKMQECHKAYIALTDATDSLLEFVPFTKADKPFTKEAKPKTTDINNKIKKLDFNEANEDEIEELFPFWKWDLFWDLDLAYIPGCGKEEMNRRINLLSSEQLAALFHRDSSLVGFKFAVCRKGMLLFLSRNQIEEIIPKLDMNLLNEYVLGDILGRYKGIYKLLSEKQIAIIERRFSIHFMLRFKIKYLFNIFFS